MGVSCDHLMQEQEFALNTCTSLGADGSVRVMAVVSGGAGMFDIDPGDILYAVNEWDSSSNTIISFGLNFLGGEQGCHKGDFDESLYVNAYCQQGMMI